MIEMEMSTDVKEYSPKIVAFLSKRQVACLAIGLSYGLPLFFAMKNVDMNLRATICTILMMPPIACGWIKMYGMPLEVFIFKCVIPLLTKPNKRKYMTEDIYGFEDKEKEKKRLVSFKNIQPKKLKRKEKKAKAKMYSKYNART